MLFYKRVAVIIYELLGVEVGTEIITIWFSSNIRNISFLLFLFCLNLFVVVFCMDFDPSPYILYIIHIGTEESKRNFFCLRIQSFPLIEKDHYYIVFSFAQKYLMAWILYRVRLQAEQITPEFNWSRTEPKLSNCVPYPLWENLRLESLKMHDDL